MKNFDSLHTIYVCCMNWRVEYETNLSCYSAFVHVANIRANLFSIHVMWVMFISIG